MFLERAAKPLVEANAIPPSMSVPSGDALKLVLVGLVYFTVAYFGLQLASIHPSATPIWPATGLAIAVVLLWGYRIAPAIFVAAFIVNYLVAGSVLTSAAIAFGNTLEAVATAFLVRRWADGEHVFATPLGVGKFAIISAVTTTISATIGVGSLLLAGYASADSAPPVWLTWWLGDFAGAVVVAPVVLLWTMFPLSRFGNALAEVAIVYLGAVIVGIIAFSPLMLQTSLRDPLGFLAIAPLLWAALRLGPRDTATVAAILAACAVWGTLMQAGPFARATQNESFLLLLMFMISTTIPSLALSADVTARRQAQERQQLLLRELSHRVGNTLAVLNSVFRRSALHARSVSELETAFQGRLMNLAATNRLLGEANWESASVRDLVKAAVEPYCPPEYESCEFTGDDMRVPVSLATSLTMVLHELATNAAKHGALKSRGGKLKVGWRQDEHPQRGKVLHFVWEETISTLGSRPPTGEAGYGIALIDSTIANLRGYIERKIDNQGISVRFWLPVS
jgi:two-component sensor histidine kinase/integral membrane sensor domain MASE1